MVIVQQVNDPLSLEKQREVRKTIRQTTRPSNGIRYEVFAWLCVALAAGAMVPARRTSGRRRRRHAQARGVAPRPSGPASIAIEASDPVPYVASQPDPQTFVVELRDVVAVGFADNVRVDAGQPFARVQVESGVAADGAASRACA